MLAAALVAMLSALVLMQLSPDERMMIVFAGATFGAGAFPLYALAVAHANDYADARESVEVSSGLLLVYGMGAAAGPLLASVGREITNTPSLFYFTAAVHVVLIAYIAWRISQRRTPDADQRVHFSEAAIVAQTVLPMEPAAVSGEASQLPER